MNLCSQYSKLLICFGSPVSGCFVLPRLGGVFPTCPLSAGKKIGNLGSGNRPSLRFIRSEILFENEEVIVPTPTWCLTARSIYFELFFFLFLTASSVFLSLSNGGRTCTLQNAKVKVAQLFSGGRTLRQISKLILTPQL